MDYHKETAEFIERICRNIEREDFVLEKEKAQECLLKTYDIFNLPRPRKIVWMKDIFEREWEDIAESAWSVARSAAWSAWSAAGSAAWSARSALDYDFDWYVFEFEYCKENKDFNENDLKYLEYCELLMQAKEAGAGYRVEWEDTLYIAPTPLVLVDAQNRLHSTTKPALRWKDASEFYYLSGVKFDKELWQPIVDKTIEPKEVLTLQNIEQRMAALKYLGNEYVLIQAGAKLIDGKTDRGNELFVIKKVFPQDEYFLRYSCPSTGRVYVKCVDLQLVGGKPSADACQAHHHNMTLPEYLEMEVES